MRACFFLLLLLARSGAASLECTAASPPEPNTDRPGGGDFGIQPVPSGPESCASYCCDTPSCVAWTYVAAIVNPQGSCVAGVPCCYLKRSAPPPLNVSYPGGIWSGTVEQPPNPDALWTGSTRPSRAPAALDCPLRALVAAYAGRLNAAVNASDVAASLLLSFLCPHARLPDAPSHHAPARPLWATQRSSGSAVGLCSLATPPPTVFFVAPTGSDAAAGTESAPFATLQRALDAVGAQRAGGSAAPACVWVRGGTFRLTAPVTVSLNDLEVAAWGGEAPVFSGALPVATPAWAPFAAPAANASTTGCWVAAGAAPLGLDASALFDAAGLAITRARWPNAPVAGSPYPAAWSPESTPRVWGPAPAWAQCESNVTTDTSVCFSNYTEQGGMEPCYQERSGCGSLRFVPPIEPGPPRGVCGGAMSPLCNTVPGSLAFTAAPAALPWAHPEDASVHAMKRIGTGSGWYSLSWRVTSATAEGVAFGTGGFQSGQGRVADGPNFDFFVEGTRELLDVDGEWHYDAREGSLYLCAALGAALPAAVELATAPYLLAIEGPEGGAPVSRVSLRGLGFARTRSTIFEDHRVPGGGDLAAHARGALTITGAAGVSVTSCTFSDIGGSAIVVTGVASGVEIADSAFDGAGAHQVLVLGAAVGADATGPSLPRGTRIAGNSMRRGGRENKFAAPIAIALAPRCTVEGNVVYECPRTAIYYNDVSGSPGQRMHNNALFNANRETTDTGPVYVYQRLAFIGDNEDGPPGVVPDVSNHTANLILTNYAGTWPLDYDDGSRSVVDSSNVLLYGGNKQYLGCCTTHTNNFIVYPDAGDGDPQCNMQNGAGLYSSGYGHVFSNNTCIMLRADAPVYDYGDCSTANALDPPRTASFNNTFLTPAGAGGLAAVSLRCGTDILSLEQWHAISGYESGSVAAALPDTTQLAAQLYAFLPGPEGSRRL